MSTPSVWVIPRESVEWVGPVTMTGGTGSLELVLLTEGTRPIESDWAAPTVIGADSGYLVSGRAPGRYRLWGRVGGSPEKPVFDDVAIVVIT